MKSWLMVAAMFTQLPAVNDSIIVIDITNAKPGRYIYALDINKLGKGTLTRVSNVHTIGGTDPIPPIDPKPEDPTDPIEPDLGDIDEKVDKILKDLPKSEYKKAVLIGGLYEKVVEFIKAGKIKTYQEVILTLRAPRTLVIGGDEDWDDVIKQLDSLDSLIVPKLKVIYEVIAEKLSSLK